MDTSIIPALAGLTGAAIGGLTSGIASWFAQKTQSRVQLLSTDKVPRQELYKKFIETARQCYADAGANNSKKSSSNAMAWLGIWCARTSMIG
jgi:hypothetical protein